MCYSKWRTDDFETSAIVYCIGVWLLWLKLNELSSAPAGRVHARGFRPSRELLAVGYLALKA